MNIVEEIRTKITSGTVIPKPEAKADFMVKGWGNRRDQAALIYFIPNHNNKDKPYQKGINVSEWRLAYNRLLEAGVFERNWFNKNLNDCAAEGGCNFTTIGGIFELLGLADYSASGVYRLRRATE